MRTEVYNHSVGEKDVLLSFYHLSGNIDTFWIGPDNENNLSLPLYQGLL